MNYKKSFNFLKKLPSKLNLFYKKKSKSGIKVNNKSKSKKERLLKKHPNPRQFERKRSRRK